MVAFVNPKSPKKLKNTNQITNTPHASQEKTRDNTSSETRINTRNIYSREVPSELIAYYSRILTLMTALGGLLNELG